MKKKLILSVVMALLLALPLISGCAAPREEVVPPEGEKYITWLDLTDFTGPIGGLTTANEMGLIDYLKDINEKGGVDGVKVNLIPIDTRYDMARGISAYHMYSGEHNLLIVDAANTGLSKILLPLVEEKGQITGGPADGEWQANPGRGFLWFPCYQDGFAAMVDFVLEDWEKKGNTGTPTIAHITMDSAYGRESQNGGAQYAELKGVKMLTPEYYPSGSAQFEPYLAKLTDADYIHIGGVDPVPSLILRDAHAMGLTDDIQFICDFYGPAEHVGATEYPEATNGAWFYCPFLRGELGQNHPVLKRLWETYQGTSSSEMISGYAIGVLRGLDLTAALKVALDEVGYENLSGDALFAGYESLGGSDSRQGLTGLCSFSPTSRRGTEYLRFYRLENGKEIAMTDWVQIPLNPSAVDLYYGK